MTERGQLVPDFDITFEWQTNEWSKLFDAQIRLIKEDIARAQAEDRVIVYLSCPISSRGGGYARTNVDIAKHTERQLLTDWGHRFWILNPAQYQMESREGTGLIKRHARELGITEEELKALPRPVGGDYMRMWTKVLVEDDGRNAGYNFDAFYFLGPTDVRAFFTRGGAVTVTAGIEEYFARKFTFDPDFRKEYTKPGPNWELAVEANDEESLKEKDRREEWELARKRFFRFYAIRASANFSLGCHDEWNIFRLINERRLELTRNDDLPNGNVGEVLAGFFDGKQIDPGAAVTCVSKGYAR